MDELSRNDIVEAFLDLSDELAIIADTGAHEVVIAGGAALVLLYAARNSTKDVDAIRADSIVLRAAARVAGRRGLPAAWLNDAAKGYAHGVALGEQVFSSDSLIVRTLAPHQLFAMKLSAWRDDVDIEDARLLLSKLSGNREEVWSLIEPFLVPGRELKGRYAFDDLWELERGP